MKITTVWGVVASLALASVTFAGGVTLQRRAARDTAVAPKGDVAALETKFTASHAVPKPARKGGARSKGHTGLTYLHVDNRSNHDVYLYRNGSYIGSVSSYGDSYGYIASGDATLTAQCSSGDAAWGPRRIDLPEDGEFTWTLLGDD